jgi:hypothetical protein
LWLENTTPGVATATITLTVAPPTEMPTLGGPLDVEVTFDDADGSWFGAWQAQAANGAAFVVSEGAGETTVRMGESVLTLAPVPLRACETRKATAHISPELNTQAKLVMHAALADGAVIAAVDANCENLPHP